MSNQLLGLLNEKELTSLQELIITKSNWDESNLIKLLFNSLQRPTPDFYNPLDLFHCHFILFNGLHRINQQNHPFYILMNVTKIAIINKDQLGEMNDDQLEKYYLNEQYFYKTSKEKIQKMLEEFVLKFKEFLLENNSSLQDSSNSWNDISNQINQSNNKNINKESKHFIELQKEFLQIDKYQ